MSTAPVRIDQSETALRRDLAACYRLIALYGWDDLIATHVSVRLPEGNGFLINPFGLMFEEITPESLIKVDLDGNLPPNGRSTPPASRSTARSMRTGTTPCASCTSTPPTASPCRCARTGCSPRTRPP